MSTNEMSHKYILVGSSGTGKSTMAGVLEEYGLKRCITTTTRPPRPGEKNGVDYHFHSNRPLSEKEYFEHACFGGYEYGITLDELSKGDFIILDPQGVDYYRANYPGSLTVVMLRRNGVKIDDSRRARDQDAGFDRVQADIIIHGETVEEMSENLISGILSYEMERCREEGFSPLEHRFIKNEVFGSARLSFNENELGLPVTSELSHHDYLEPPYGHDFLSSFDGVNYSNLCFAFRRMAERGIHCTLDFYSTNEYDECLYSCRLRNEHRRISMDMVCEYLGAGLRSYTFKDAKEAAKVAFGGFVASQIDSFGEDMLDMADSDAVQAFRKLVSAGNFELCSTDSQHNQRTLDDMIQDAENSCKQYSDKTLHVEHSR